MINCSSRGLRDVLNAIECGYVGRGRAYLRLKELAFNLRENFDWGLFYFDH